MAQYIEVGSGAIGINWANESPKDPDFRGRVTFDGVDFSISAWTKHRNEDGRIFYSFNISKIIDGPDRKTRQPKTVEGKTKDRDDPNDDIPF